MKYIVLYEAYNSQEISLPEEIKQIYLKELGQHVSLPQILEKNPGEWQAIVNDGEPPEDRIRGLPYTVHQLAKLTRDHSAKVWGTPQAAFDNFYGWVSDLGGDEDEWHDLGTYTVDDYMRMSGKTREIATMMKAVYDGFQIVDWLEVK
jgi:hypothetical protein